MPSVLLIHNPVAARTNADTLGNISRVFESAGWSLDVAETGHADDSRIIASQGVSDGVDVVAVYGGDGTTIQAVEGMIGSDVKLGLLPGGTGNLLAGNLRLPRDPVQAAEVIVTGSPQPVDLGRLECSGSVRHFSVGVGAGFDAAIMTETTEAAKSCIGMAAYVFKTIEVLGRLEPVQHRVTIDGHSLDIEATDVLVVNCGEIIPPFLRLKRGISPRDGLLDVILLNPTNIAESVAVFFQMVTGRVNGKGRLQYARGKVVTVETEREQPVEMDGDGAGVTPFTAEVVPNGIEVFLPSVV